MKTVEIKKGKTLITLEVDLEELGTFICGLGATNREQIAQSAEFNNVETVKDSYDLYEKLHAIYKGAVKI
jgi:hypothetical protein